MDYNSWRKRLKIELSGKILVPKQLVNKLRDEGQFMLHINHVYTLLKLATASTAGFSVHMCVRCPYQVLKLSCFHYFGDPIPYISMSKDSK